MIRDKLVVGIWDATLSKRVQLDTKLILDAVREHQALLKKVRVKVTLY